EKDDSNQERDMVVSRNHVFRAQVNESRDRGALIGFDEGSIALGDIVRAGSSWKYERSQDEENSREGGDPTQQRFYLHRSASSVFSRHLSWQLEQAVLRSPAAVKILSIFLDCAAL